MKRSSFFVMAVGLVLVGLFTIRCTGPSTPVITFLSPTAGEPIVATDDPVDTPITVSVDVAFPPAINPCAGTTFAVIPSTLRVTLKQMDDSTVLNEREIDASGWWTQTMDEIQGEITIGGETSGESWGVYWLCVYIENEQGPVENDACLAIRVEKPIDTYVGGTYTVRITGLRQSPAGCILPDIVLGPVNDMIGPLTFQVTMVDAGLYPTSISLPLPYPIGIINVDARVDETNNDIAFDPVEHAIDFGQLNLPIPGGNCLIQGTADGAIDGQTSPGADDLDGTIRVSGMEVSLGSGAGDCILTTPDPECSLYITIDGNPVGQ